MLPVTDSLPGVKLPSLPLKSVIERTDRSNMVMIRFIGRLSVQGGFFFINGCRACFYEFAVKIPINERKDKVCFVFLLRRRGMSVVCDTEARALVATTEALALPRSVLCTKL